ncbi:MAG TPA: ABC transporter ATP-binding protein [Leifsonia sp.]|nr:ABC transporter ATP-binding protein [Leifsonia sp.]
MSVSAVVSGRPSLPSGQAARPALAFDGIDVVYRTAAGNIPAVENLSLSVPQGTFLSILGPSGCGKSTLIKVAAGLLSPSRGEVSVAGSRVTAPHPDVGIVFQQPTLLPWKTVEDNILVPVRARGGHAGEARARARELIALVKLAGFERNYPHELSGGMQQRVALARALMHDPPVLVMDEPFAALDALTREQMMLELQRLWSVARKTVLFVTHSIQEAVFLSDRVVVLSPRPARITTDIPITLQRPRTLATLMEPAFAAACDTLRQELYRSQPA